VLIVIVLGNKNINIIIMSKNEIISKKYHDPAGYGSIRDTYLEARQKDKSITYDDVKKWMYKETEQKKQLKGYNSYIANAAKEEYQIDLFFINRHDFPNEKFVGGILAIDIFTRFVTVIPIKTKTIPEISDAIKTIINKMGKPQTIYTDNEGAWSKGTEIDKYFIEQNINHIITLSHPAYSERAIRTIKAEIYKRVKTPSDKNWDELLYPVLLKYNYKSVHRGTGFTPAQADKSDNHFVVKFNMEKHRKNNRKYPDIEIGDYVRVHRNKDKLDKEHISTWGDKRYKVDNIVEVFGQNYYYLDGYTQNGRKVGLLRHDIFLTV
jgi:hypothetical protein